MTGIESTARQAGILYVLVLFSAPLTLIYFPGLFIVSGDAAATALKISGDLFTYRIWIFASLVSTTLFLFVAWSLWRLFRDVDAGTAMIMLLLVVVVTAFQLVNLLSLAVPLVVLSGADFLSVFTRAQLEAVAMVALRLRSQGMHLATAFWGLWLIPFGLLVIKSRWFPRFLGVLLILAGVAYLAVSFTSIVYPSYRGTVDRVALPFYAAGELLIILWLAVRGARVPATGPGSARAQ